MGPSETNDHVVSALTNSFTDIDPEETSEWIESFDDLVDLRLRGREQRSVGGDVAAEGVDGSPAGVLHLRGIGRGSLVVAGLAGHGDLTDVDVHSQTEGDDILGGDEQFAQGAEVDGEPGVRCDPVLRLMRAEAEIGPRGEQCPRQGHKRNRRQSDDECSDSPT